MNVQNEFQHLKIMLIRYRTRSSLSLVVLVVVFGSVFNLAAQRDSIAKFKASNNLLKKAVVPTILIGSSLLITYSDFEVRLQQSLRKGKDEDFNTSIDDYTRFVPLAQMYVADIAGIKSRSHWFDQTKNAALSLFITDIITTRLKQSIDKSRPSGANNNAFPSAHTAYAFTSATVLFEEFKDTSLVLAYSGYAFAVTTGYLRMAKNTHWFSDVLLGAGIGIAITKLVYHFDYLIAWNPFKKKNNIMIAPNYYGGRFGISGIIRF